MAKQHLLEAERQRKSLQGWRGSTLLMDLLRRHAPDAQAASFKFKAVWPIFDTMPTLKELTAVTMEHANAAPCASRQSAATRTGLTPWSVSAKEIARLRAAGVVCA